jgi:hypothetical protein
MAWKVPLAPSSEVSESCVKLCKITYPIFKPAASILQDAGSQSDWSIMGGLVDKSLEIYTYYSEVV